MIRHADGTVRAEESEQYRALLAELRANAEAVVRELIEAAQLKAGQILVVGCSSSEVIGSRIGQASIPAVADAILDGMLPILRENEIYLAAQCCEHLNRALILERECAERYGLDEVCVRPQPKAGGSFATGAHERFADPVAVEHVRAHAGLDIGGTLIGMHLREVAVPLRLSVAKLGDAHLLCARTRPKYIGGPRARYE
ncbi:MAG: TIGR01440 family protein [Clostridia bacterium]|nr:TIGR01440 family protein [Clostridia bacterium]